MKRLCVFSFKLIALVFTAANVYAQGCTTPPCAPNTVPCAHCIGTWTDDATATWTLTSPANPTTWNTFYTVTGTMRNQTRGPGCPVVTYQLQASSSSINPQEVAGQKGWSYIVWDARNPSPSTSCNGQTPLARITYRGQVFNNGCDFSNGTWDNSGGGHGTFTATKPSEVPTGENTRAVAWWSLNPTVMIYEQTLFATNDMAGRQVYEASNGTPVDNCWFTTSSYRPAALSGGGWYVGYYFFDDRWHYDYVGYDSGAVTYYRANHRTPCTATIPQAMRIYTNDRGNGPTGSLQYATDTLILNIPDSVNYGTSRAGVQAWRTYP